jgi:GNAT superfamily N-acetyltransferase
MSIHNEKDSLPEADLFTAIGDKRVYFPLGSLGRTVVHPDYRGQGLQGQLLTAREDTAQEMGIMQMFAVATGLSNFSYYKSKGFRFLGSGPQYKDFKQNHHEYICIIKDLEQSQAQAL